MPDDYLRLVGRCVDMGEQNQHVSQTDDSMNCKHSSYHDFEEGSGISEIIAQS